MERFLQLCARDNMFVADVSTPANLFHLLRRQMLVGYRKPLVVFTPKSLLRHPKCVSTVEDLAEGRFQEVIDDAGAQVSEVQTLVFCTGKFYYDLLAAREELGRTDVALVRLEQLFPLPVEQMQAIIAKYDKADDLVWAQEEPRNMGAWSHLMMHFPGAARFRVASRRIYASPAAGSPARSRMRHQQVIDFVFDKSKDNTSRPKSVTAATR
jgi:2-oxoglutarate dehydrogenase E1 component